MAAGGVGIAVLQLCRTVEDVVTLGTASAAARSLPSSVRAASSRALDAVFPFAEAEAASRPLTERRNVGKVVLVP